jgi:SAM-dependent methyltransferase
MARGARHRWRAAKAKAVPFVEAAIGNLGLARAVIRDRAFLSAKIAEKHATESKLADFHAGFALFLQRSEAGGGRLPVRWDDRHPCLDDRSPQTPFDRHYLYHPAWAARILARTRPDRHVDISSTVNFSAIVSAFVPVDFFDFRPAPIFLDNLNSRSANLLELPFADNSVHSLSCMHVLEHVGLGRYGEPIDPDGDLKSIRELVRVLAPGGNLLVATPVGTPRVAFNAHRVYDFAAFRRYFEPLELVEFALIREIGEEGLIMNPPEEVVRAESYGCGCYWFRKRASS